MEKHVLSVLTINKSGVLSKIAGLLRRKLFNVDSLTVGRTANPEKSYFTIVIEGERKSAEKAAKHIEALIDVLEVQILEKNTRLVREIVLAKFAVPNPQKKLLLAEAEKGILVKTLDEKPGEITVELIDRSQVIEEFLEKIKLADIGILHWVRSGMIAMEK